MGKPVLNAAPLWRGLAAALAACGVALLLACGPGVGGTGTGSQEALAAFGAAPATLCASTLAASLGCPASPGSGAALPWLVDSASAARVTAHVSGDDIAFEAICEGLHFAGRWGAVSMLLHDSQGRVLSGPRLLWAQATPPPAAACP